MKEQDPRLRAHWLRSASWVGAFAALSGSALARQTLVHEARGNAAGEGFGAALDVLGDVDGDGSCDWIVGGADSAQNGIGSGRVLVLSGADGGVLHELLGRAPGQGLGFAVTGTGDVDGDTIPDFALSELQGPRGPWSGEVRIQSGADGRLLRSVPGDAAYDGFGASIDGAGDLDGDGLADVVIGAPGSDAGSPDAGLVRVVSGRSGLTIRQWTGTISFDGFGSAVRGIGDLDGDGFGEIAIASPMHRAPSASNSGLVTVYSGQTGAWMFEVAGNGLGSEFGRSLAAAGDVDQDGVPDFLVGAPGDSTFHPQGGSVRLCSGLFGATLHEWYGEADSGRFGNRVAGLGDLDGDGRFELGVASGGGIPMIRVYSGLLDPDPLLELGDGSSDWDSACLAGGGDLNGDGYADVLVGAPRADSNGMDSGSAFVFSGHEHVVRYCFGDGSGSSCPCFNSGTAGAGCANSTGSGSSLDAAGSASLADDELRFTATELPLHLPALLFCGSAVSNGGAGRPFGDGLRCTSGGVARVGLRTPDASGSATWGPGLSRIGGWSAGDTRRFQVWYRDPSGPCGQTFNLTNGVELVFSH